MDRINAVLRGKKLEPVKKPKPVEVWQDLAAQIYQELKGVDTEKASVFMLCKEDYAGAYAAFRECKERSKNILYWFKIMYKGKRKES
ncbi:MAG: hypothetical protein A3B30_02885 [Candidatus Komeilibacteria bacterium RIFCSPLOWO2_01_FULL_52_15]|uniref:Uncharacterized protein n=2 Tax=Candidatus Komeiliibacteriota TaxID=1817908 RepID=A0A1G2BSY9_9BACT|nr:MAG: hypothetical protein A2677_02360 [Candidatus Komeilibacteria bacterium RIFCSPHIGHO2_01_FULL_52_14]OGY91470.1 MAG: hypothetical protein A3B30_02885 [Candidatus Komeilibacteria bacterium RIFCSPLOWO2_01_FULL_52_15]